MIETFVNIRYLESLPLFNIRRTVLYYDFVKQNQTKQKTIEDQRSNTNLLNNRCEHLIEDIITI